MKVLVVLLGLITTTFLSGVAAIRLSVSAYNATGELDIRRDPFTLGTRVFLTCDVTGLPEGSEALSYKWHHNCARIVSSRCEIRDGDPYYRVVKDILLVDVTSLDQGGRYYCTVQHRQESQMVVTRELSVAGDPAPFLYTPTSLLPEHSVLTDVQQTTGRNEQQWITCKSGGEGTRPEIWMGSELVVNSSTANSVTIGLGTQQSNGLYHCLSGQSQREYFSVFFTNSVTLRTSFVSGWDSTRWTLTSPDGSRVERYIVEYECRVRNITFVEKYMSVNASGGTGRVATSVSCFGGLGQLYRVKVRAVSGPNISRALVCTPDRQCSEEEVNPTIASDRRTPTTPTSVPTPSGNTDQPPLTPSGPRGSSTEHNHTQSVGNYIPSMVVPVSAGALMFIVGIATFIAGVVMLVRAKRVLHHSFQSPPPGTDHYEMVDERGKRAPLGAGVYEEVYKQDIQTEGHTKNYQELEVAKMERREYASIKVK